MRPVAAGGQRPAGLGEPGPLGLAIGLRRTPERLRVVGTARRELGDSRIKRAARSRVGPQHRAGAGLPLDRGAHPVLSHPRAPQIRRAAGETPGRQCGHHVADRPLIFPGGARRIDAAVRVDQSRQPGQQVPGQLRARHVVQGEPCRGAVAEHTRDSQPIAGQHGGHQTFPPIWSSSANSASASRFAAVSPAPPPPALSRPLRSWAAIKRLVASVSKLLDPADALAATAGSDLVFLESRPFGGAFVLDALWRRLGIDKVITALDAAPRRGRPREVAVTERALFGLVVNRALAPSPELAAAEWISNDVHIENLPGIGEQACYRAMDWLHDVRERLEAGVFDKVATLLNLEAGLLFFDTTSTYFELGEPDEPVARDEKGHRLPGGEPEDTETEKAGFRTHGNSKDSRDDLPQIVIGMAVTRDGIPVRCWCWPGNASDQVVIRQVKDEMRDWTLSEIVWVTDRRFSSAENRRYLRSGDHHYITGE